MPFVPPSTYTSQGVTGYLSQFFIGTLASPLGYTAVLECRTIKTNNFTVPEIDYTHLQSPNTTEESGPGLIKPGTIELTGTFRGDTTQLAIPAIGNPGGLNYGEVFAYKITANVQRGAATYTQTGQCYLVKWEVGPFENNKPVDFAASFKVSGSITEAVA